MAAKAASIWPPLAERLPRRTPPVFGTAPAKPLTASQRLAIALLLSLCLHAAVIIGLNFPPAASQMQGGPVLDAVLIRPTPAADSQPVAATEVEGASERPAGARTASPTPQKTATPKPDTTAQPMHGQTAALGAAMPPGPVAPTATADAKQRRFGQGPVDYLALREEIAALGLEAARRSQAAGAAPRVRQLSNAADKSAAEAAYLKMWRQRIERIGNANYPANAAYGDLRVQVRIRHDGALLDARVVESSGVAALDAAALRIVRLAAPFAQFSVDMRKSYDQLEITRRWRFSRLGAQLAE